jgi:hypothetical protein
MKLFKALMLSAVLFMTPTAALADWNFGHFGGWIHKIFSIFHRDYPIPGGGDEHQNPIPEPSGALIMGTGLAVAVLVRHRNRSN